jgi:thiol-disulfide isomerase/thioredoxin
LKPFPSGLVVVSRDGCGLCDAMIDELAELATRHPVPAHTVVDVDSDPDWVRRFSLDVPVLLLDGSVVCRYELNRSELLRLLVGVARSAVKST